MQDNRITKINIVDGSVLRHIQFECFGYNFGIYKVKQGNIIYGEMEITMLDFDFVKKWYFSEKDILFR